MQSGEVKLLSFKWYLLQVWTTTQYKVDAFRSGRVTRLALLLRLWMSED